MTLILSGTNGVSDIDGDASTPAIRGTDANTGIFFPAADTIGLAVGGVEGARVVSGLLSIPANSTAASAVRLYEDTDNGTNYVDIIAPAAVTSNRTLTLPDNTGTVITTGSTFAGTGPAFLAFATTGQLLSALAWNKIQLNSETYDTASCFDTGTYRFTPNVAGYYQISGNVSINGVTASDTNILGFYKNGSEFVRGSRGANLAGENIAITGSVLVYLNGTTDYLELYVFSIAANNLEGAANYTFMSGALVRAA